MNATTTLMVCGECGIEYSVPEDWRADKEKTGKAWFCPNGHQRVYRETVADKLRKKLADAEERERMAKLDVITERNRANLNEAKAEKAAAKLRRVRCGVCPECNRSFLNLKRHMASKHA